ncbi:peptidylprolyl isomerase [Lentibacter sp.]|uniref:peptidylprolyl isomerase n=1 Tax=Lentibacter sp. TaxID=2024994 RepID=UPI003F6A070C
MITRTPLLSLLIALLAVTVTVSSTAQSQNLFAPAIKVNDKVITQFDLNQRSLMLAMFRAPGDPAKEARAQLIEERLKLDAAQALGVLPAGQEITTGMAEFAARANMSTEEFLAALKQGGIEEQTFRDFIVSGVAWRSLVRARFGPKVEVGDTDIDQALNATTTDSIRVLLSEIIIPAPPAEAAAAQARANELSQITTESAFAAAARQYSATATSARGGRLEWMPLSNLPPALHPIILGLGRGQVSDPIPIDGAIALFQMRGIEEGKVATPIYSAIEYAAYYIAGGRSPDALATARKLTNTVDTCDDLYGVAKGQPEEVLERGSKAPADIPSDIALELAKLDKHEVSTALTRADGQTLVFLMLCGRTPKQAEGVDRDQIGISLQNRRLASYADGYLAQLRSEARIIEY